VVARHRGNQNHADDTTEQTDTDSHGVAPLKGARQGTRERVFSAGILLALNPSSFNRSTHRGRANLNFWRRTPRPDG
jgi:hypothetical protein